MKNIFSKLKKTNKVFAATAAGLVVIAAAVIGLGVKTAPITAETCSSNDIVKCGASSPASFISKVKSNAPGDLDNIYAKYNLPKSQYDEFKNYAKKGKINPNNGNITVSGKTVGYDGLSLGRNSKGSISKAVKIDGKTYYQSHIKDLTKYFNDAMVLFDSKGNVQTVIMNLCGNPIKVTPNNPKYACKMLNVSEGKDNLTFNFSSKVDASNGAKVTKVVYDFGDGTKQTETSPSKVVSHSYAKAGTYNATVTAYVKTTFGRGEFPITVTADCKKVVTVKETEKPSVDITKTVDGVKSKTVALNTPFTYQLVVKNTGNVDLKDAVITDPSPNAKIVFVSTDKGTIVNNALSYTIASLKVGASETINITAKLTDYVDGDIVNKACVDTPTVPGSPDDCDTANINSPKPAVAIEKLVNGVKRDQVAVNEVFTYTVKVTNTGKVDLVDALVTDPAPAGVTLLTTDKGDISGNALSYNVTLKVGASDVITMTAKVNAYKAGDIVNTACVDAVEVVNPSNPYAKDACDTATVTVPKPKTPAVKIEKLVNGQKNVQVDVNETFTYTVKVTNNGEVDLVSPVVNDPAPENVQFLTTDKGTITGNVLNYTIPGTLKVGASDTITLTAKVTKQVEGSIKNTACVYATEVNPSSPTTADDCDDAYVHVPPVVPHNPNISIVKTVNGVKKVQVMVGAPFTYKLVVKNTGDIDMTNVVVRDDAPDGVTLLSSDLGTITDGSTWTYTIPSLKIGESKEFTMTAKVTEQTDDSLVNTACVNAPEVNPGEPDKDDACDTATVTVPTELPNTGAGNIVALFFGTTLVAGIGYRLFLGRKLQQIR